MEATFYNIGVWCGLGGQGEKGEKGNPQTETNSSAPASASIKPTVLRPRPSSTTTPAPSILPIPERSTAKGSATALDENDGSGGNVPVAQAARSAAQKHVRNKSVEFIAEAHWSSASHLARNKSFDSLPGRIANAPVAQSAAHAHFAKGKGPANEVVDIGRNESIMEDEDGADDPYGDLPEDGTESTCPESCPPSPHPAPAAVMLDLAPEDELALEVGHTAFEYLEECFHCTEVSVLDREKFNAIPEIVKSDFIITGHLGKGNFSDVFEVVRKATLPASSPAARNMPPPQSGRRRSRRSSDACPLSISVTTATLASPSCGERKLVLAMKCLRPQIRSDVDQFIIGAEDLVHETAILATLDHRHIIKLHGRASGNLTDAFVLNDGYFILLDRLSETLYDRIGDWKVDRHIKLGGPDVEQIQVAHSVADALSYLHSKNIVFRDLKPDNVGFDALGVLKLFDFGFAAGLPEKDEDNPAGFLFDRCGTPRYMAPEVGLSLGYGLAADVYSYGIFLWEVSALCKPFSTVTSAAEFERAVFMGGKRPEVDRRWPAALGGLMARCWSASPSKRPGDWTDVKSSLSPLLKNGDATTKSAMKRHIMARRNTENL